MYLENYYIFKGQLYLTDKISLVKVNKIFSDNFYLQFNINIKKKKDKIIMFLMLNFMNLANRKSKIYSIFTLKSSSELFTFINNFILIWLVFSSSIKNIFLHGGTSKRNLILELKELPLITETEKLIEINTKYIQLFKEINVHLIIFKQFYNYSHKETFSRLLKMPIIK
jgi:hypothetical protein